MARARPVLLIACGTLVLGLSGCDLLDGKGEFHRALPIDSRILITFSEQLHHSGRSLILNCRTEKEYGCYNYRLVYSRSHVGPVIRIDFHYIGVPEVCLTAMGPARAEIDLGALAPGKYLLAVAAGGKSVGAELSVSSGSYVLTNGEGPTVNFPSPRLLRVPDRTIWGLIGYLGYAGEPFDSLADAFLDSLAARGAAVSSFEPGDYGYFAIDESGAIQPPPNHGYYFARPYIRHFAGDPAALRDVVAHFGKTQSRWLSVQLLTWRGDAYFGWVLGSDP